MINQDGDNLVFLLSLPRSGSTVLSLMLGSHSKIYCAPEPWFLLKLNDLVTAGSPDAMYDDHLATVASEEFLKNDIQVEAMRSFACTAYNHYLKQRGKKIFVDKTPRYYHILTMLDTVFPKAKKIWLKRNPLDVVASYKKAWGVTVDQLTGRALSHASYDLSFGLFELAEYFGKRSKLKLEISYESFVEAPSKVLTEICDFVGLRFEQPMLSYSRNRSLVREYAGSAFGDKTALKTKSISKSSLGRWKEELTTDEIQQIADLIGARIFRRLGYQETVVTLHELGVKEFPESEAAKRRQRVIHARKSSNEILAREAKKRLIELGHKELEIKKLKNVCDARESAMHRKEEEIERLRSQGDLRLRELGKKDKEIEKVRKAADARLAEIEAMHKAQKKVDALINEMKHEMQGLRKELEIRLAEMQKMASALQEKDKENVAMHKAQKAVDALMNGMKHEMEALHKELEKRLAEMQKMAGALQAKEEQNVATQKTAEERGRELVEKEREIAATHQAAEERSAALLEKEELISAINKAADERAAALEEEQELIRSLKTFARDRQKIAEERARELLEKEREIAATQRAAEERSRELLEKEEQIVAMRKRNEERGQALLEKEREIAAAHQAAEERCKAVLEKEAEIASLRSVAEDRFIKMQVLTQELEVVKKSWGFRAAAGIRRLLERIKGK